MVGYFCFVLFCLLIVTDPDAELSLVEDLTPDWSILTITGKGRINSFHSELTDGEIYCTNGGKC